PHDPGLAAAEAADAAAQALDGAETRLALTFASAGYASGLASAAAAVEARLQPGVLLGAVAQGVVGPRTEVEDGPAVSVWCATWEGGDVLPFRSMTQPVPEGGGLAVVGWPDTRAGDVVVVLADPRSYPAAQVIDHLGHQRPGHRIVGGLVVAGAGPGRFVLGARDGREVFEHGAVGVVLRGVPVRTVVSQGCRPVGEPYVVTSAEGNVVLQLAGEPATARLREVFAGASEEDRERMQHGLHVGLVADEYRDRYDTGDFLIRAVVGAEESSGGIAIGDQVRVGQTIQFQVRDAASAHADLHRALRTMGGHRAAGALLFTCNGRGRRFFGQDHHDARVLAEAITGQVAGVFCAGEIGPVGDRSFVHGFTASLAVFERDGDA
ncbi:MAG TPA: FIST C-terminal domain-containing protein, partial [Nitriliruptorales bacterium]|nr:FIST C-terminal domain-containing protein [Nitriliruptorales bacterium]